MYLKTLQKLYKEALQKEAYEYIDFDIAPAFWEMKKVRRAFEKYIGTKEEPKRINPNPYGTPDYYSMKPSEQGNVEGMFMDDVLEGRRAI